MARPRQVMRPEQLRIDARLRFLVRHRNRPVLPVAIPDDHRNRRTERLAQAHAAEQLRPVAFDLHPATSAVAALASGELGIDVPCHLEGEPCRNTLEKSGQAAAV